jgi:imidazolonepropionase-like amidohydrolase
VIRSIVAIACTALASAAHAETIVIVHAKAWTLTADAPVEDATIVITDGRIAAVSAGAPAPQAARVIDAGGKPVTPGLMHPVSHLGLVEVGAASETVDHTAKSAQAPGAAFDVQRAINPHAAQIQLARADGLTRAVTHPGGSSTPTFDGVGALLRLFDRGDVLETPQVGVFVTIGGRSANSTVGSRAAQWQLLRTALDTAKTNLAAAASSTNRPPETLTLERVLNGKTPLAINTNRASDVREAARLARDFKVRVIVIGGAEAWMAADELAAANVAVVLNPMSNLPWSFDELGSRLDNAALLRKAGVTIALNLGGVQSYNAGTSIREGAGIAVANGLPYVEGLRAIVSGPASIWGVSERYGTLEAGKDADVVIWDGDPLEPSSAPSAVFVAGREVSRVTHQSALRDRYLPAIEKARADASVKHSE